MIRAAVRIFFTGLCLLAAGCSSDEMPGVIWTCTSVDGQGARWQAQNFNQVEAFDRASDACSENASDPTSCQVPACSSSE